MFALEVSRYSPSDPGAHQRLVDYRINEDMFHINNECNFFNKHRHPIMNFFESMRRIFTKISSYFLLKVSILAILTRTQNERQRNETSL